MLELNAQILWNFANIILLYFILKRFLFGPVTKIMDQREEKICNSIRDAEDKVRLADENRAEYEKKLADAEHEAREIIDQAARQAKVVSADIINTAKKEAGQIVSTARTTAQFESDAAVRGVHDELVGLALLAASKVMEKNVGTSSDKETVDAFLKEAGV